jgi:hypothetical protein
MESVYHIVAIPVNETSWAHVWRLHFRYLGTVYDTHGSAPQYLMSTYFTHRRMTSSNNLINEGLRGYFWGNLPRVPWAVGYSPKILDTTSSIQRQTVGEPNTPYQETTPSLQDKEMGPPT